MTTETEAHVCEDNGYRCCEADTCPQPCSCHGEPEEQEEDYEGEARLLRWERAREEWWA